MRVVSVPLGAQAYDITIGPGALATLPEVLRTRCPAHRYAIIADSTVAGLYGDAVLAAATEAGAAAVFSFPAGEWNKTREHWATISDAMAHAGIGRDGAVIALGGGVTGDLGGFVAATYRRGIPFVQVPTTLLAMVDSSVGGKTGVDTPHGKNLVGAFHQPRAVVADVAVLRSLPDPHVRAGLAEAVKHGAIADRGHFARIGEMRAPLLARDPEALMEVVSASVAIKAEVVGADAREHGRRAILNFGHTVAHALERVSGYALLHGEAVAIGMAVEATLGTAIGITREGTSAAVREALQALNLPVDASDADPDAVLDAMTHDKKTRGDTVKFAFLQELGHAAGNEARGWTFSAPAEAIRRALLA